MRDAFPDSTTTTEALDSLPVPAQGAVIPFEATLRGALGRFLPAGVLLSLIVVMVTGGLELGVLVLIGLAEAVLMGGYVAGLELLRRWLRADAGVDGRKSVIAGLVAPLAFFCVDVLVGGSGLLAGLLLAVLTGFAVAVLLFFPWLRTSAEADDLRDGSAQPMFEGDR